MIAYTLVLTGMDLVIGKIKSTIKTPKAIRNFKL